MKVIDERKKQISENSGRKIALECEKPSAAGSVSQRACVFCGSRVVLYPVADALHLVHGPLGCAAYTWDIRGALSSGPELHRSSFSTDLREKDVIFGGEKKLAETLRRLIDIHKPKAAFVYSTCIVGIIGDDVEAVCAALSAETGIQVIPVHSEGFKGTKKDGYKAACTALMRLIAQGDEPAIDKSKPGINILGEFNLAGETWILRDYYQKMGVEVVSVMTGDGRIGEIRGATSASLNVVQCSGSMTHLAKMMEEKYGIPYIRVSYFGIEDMSDSLYAVADFFAENFPGVRKKAAELVSGELGALLPLLGDYKRDLQGKKAAIYVGGAFKAISLVKALRHLGMKIILAGSQTGSPEDYKLLSQLCDDDCVLVDDSNPVELSSVLLEKGADLFIGGVKERPMAYKLGIGFCDHNHERKIPLAGFVGMERFAREVHNTVMSPVWSILKSSGGLE